MNALFSSGEYVNDTESFSLDKENGQRDFVPTESHQRAQWTFFFLWFFTVAVFARPEDIFPFLAPLHLTFVFGACAGLTYLAGLVSGHIDLQWTPELKIVLLLTGWYIAGLPFAYWRSGSFQTLTQVWLKTFLIFFLLTQVLTTVERIRKLLWAVILSELVVTSISIFLSSQAIWVGERLLGFNLGILGWNFLGIAEALMIPYIAAIFVVRRSVLEAGLLIAAVTSMTWMLMLTASRSGFMDVVLSAALTWFLVLRGKSSGRLIGAAMALALVVALCLAPQVFWERLGTMWDTAGSSTNDVAASARESEQNHLTAFTRSIEYTLEYPMFGLGLGNFQVVNGNDLGVPDAWIGTHNTFTEISSEAGIPALLLFVALLVTALRNIRKMSKISATNPEGGEVNLLARATQVSLLSFAFGAFFAHLGYEYYFFYLVGIGVGIQQITGTLQAVSSAPSSDFTATAHIVAAN